MLVIIAPTARDHLRGSERDPRQEIGTEGEFGHFLQAPWRGHPKVNHPLKRVEKEGLGQRDADFEADCVMNSDLSWLFSFPSCPGGPLMVCIILYYLVG